MSRARIKTFEDEAQSTTKFKLKQSDKVICKLRSFSSIEKDKQNGSQISQKSRNLKLNKISTHVMKSIEVQLESCKGSLLKSYELTQTSLRNNDTQSKKTDSFL